MKLNKFKTLGFIIILILALAFIVTSTYEMVAKSSLEKMASKALQTKVDIGSLDISPFSGNASLVNIRIQNPNGFSDKKILELPYLYASIDLNTVFSDTVIINEIRSEDMVINFELNENGSNLNALQNNINRGEKLVASEEKEAAQEGKPQKRVIISELRMNGSKLHASIAQQEALSVDINNIYLQNIGEGSTVTTQEAIAIVLQSVVKSAMTASSKISIKAGIERVLQGTKDVGEGLKSLFEKQ